MGKNYFYVFLKSVFHFFIILEITPRIWGFRKSFACSFGKADKEMKGFLFVLNV